MTGPTLDDIQAAAGRIGPHLHRTPVMTSATLDRQLGAQVFFKCENLQKIGAFKARGALNAVLSLDPPTATRGVITHSSGNHGAALAYAASIRSIHCTVVMPTDTQPVKVEAVRGYGAEIITCERAERDEVCQRIAEERGSVLVHPFEHPHVIAGQGTVALELLEEIDDLDLIIAPVGGGGLLAGTSITARSMKPYIRVVGAEPEAVDDAYQSLSSGVLRPAPQNPQTVGDGLMTGLGQINFDILRERETTVITVSESEILTETLFVLQRMKLVIEPSAATVVAALRRLGDSIRGQRVGAIFSGGNTDFSWLPLVGSSSSG